MSLSPMDAGIARRRDPLPLILSGAALLVSLVALVFAMSGTAPAQRGPDAYAAPKAARHKKAPAKKSQAKKTPAKKKQGQDPDAKAIAALEKKVVQLKGACPISAAIDLGSWCLESSTFKVPTAEQGQNDYVWAAQKCVAEGGWLPTAAQLIGAAPEAALKSTVDDDPGTSADSEFPEAKNGIKDEREMTADLFTTDVGLRAAGSEGVSEGAKGVGSIGEPNPVPAPAEPLPETLAYVTVYDNHNLGGFAGGEPVGKAENFRCAYAKGYQGKPKDVSSRS
jgi:hypothetical protein